MRARTRFGVFGLGWMCIVYLAMGAPRDHAPSPVWRQLGLLFDDPALSRGSWGVKVVSLDTGETLYELNPDRYLLPASNMKLVTAVAAIEELGLDYRFKTTLAAAGPVEGEVLKGDLVVTGSGDPTLGARLSSPDLERPELGEPLAIFREWAEKLKGRGIRRIAGDLIGDDAVFEEARPGRGWAWDDLAFGYAAENGGLQFNENVVLLSVRPGAVGELAVLQPSPSTSFIEIGNSLRTTAVMDLDLDVVRADRANRFVLKGSIPSTAEPFVQSLSVADPSSYFLVVLRETLEAAGIRIEGAVKTRRALTAELNQPLTTLHVHESPDLRYVLRVLLKTSQNLYAETLVKAVAPAPLGKSHADGRRQVERILTRLGVPPDAYQLADGSGLSRLNFLTADTLVRLLRHVYRQPYRADFLDCLPIAGVDGTLRRRMKGTAAAQNVRAKTGTLAHVRALSGYVTTRDGETLAFSMLANNFTQPLRVPEYAQDAALEYLANLSRQGESGYLRPRASAPTP